MSAAMEVRSVAVTEVGDGRQRVEVTVVNDDNVVTLVAFGHVRSQLALSHDGFLNITMSCHATPVPIHTKYGN